MQKPKTICLLLTLCCLLTGVLHAQPAQGKFYQFFEAESGSKNDSLQKRNDAQASGGQHVWAPTGRAHFDFQIPRDGVYRIWGRVIATDGHTDSFLVGMDDAPFQQWNNITKRGAWVWDDIHDSRNKGETIRYQLSAGKHTLHLKSRTDDNSTKLDRLLITDDFNFTPADDAAVKPAPGAVLIAVEPEDGKVEAPFAVGKDAAASKGKYVWTPDADATYEFTVTKAGTYKVWVKATGPEGNGSAMFAMDDAPFVRWLFAPTASASAWRWNPVFQYDGKVKGHTEKPFELQPGKHVFRLQQHKEGTKIDCLFVTDDLDFIPSDAYPAKTTAGERVLFDLDLTKGAAMTKDQRITVSGGAWEDGWRVTAHGQRIILDAGRTLQNGLLEVWFTKKGEVINADGVKGQWISLHQADGKLTDEYVQLRGGQPPYGFSKLRAKANEQAMSATLNKVTHKRCEVKAGALSDWITDDKTVRHATIRWQDGVVSFTTPNGQATACTKYSQFPPPYVLDALRYAYLGSDETENGGSLPGLRFQRVRLVELGGSAK